MAVRNFTKIAEDTIQFDNGTQVQFIPGVSLPTLHGQVVTVTEFMDYLFSDQYLLDLDGNG